MSENYYINNLYFFQDLVLKLIMKVDDTFYLAGGTALGRHYLEHRYSDDLDLFVNRNNDFKQLTDIIISQLLYKFDTQRLTKINWIKEPDYDHLQKACQIIAKDIIIGGENSLAGES